MHTIHGASIRSLTLQRARRAETSRGGPTGALGAAGLAALLPVGVLDAALSSADAAPAGRNPKAPPPTVAATTGSECLIGGSAVAGSCVVTSQQPVLLIPGSGSGKGYIVDGSPPDQSNAWVSPAITLSPIPPGGRHPC